MTSLLKQLLYQLPKIPSCVETAYDDWIKSQRNVRPSGEQFAQLFTECAKQLLVFVLLDAFDECQKTERKTLITYL
jgi:hypothetical protein